MTPEYADFLYRKLTRKADGNMLEPTRSHEWEKRFIEVHELHMEIAHLKYCLREVTKARTLSLAKKTAHTGLNEE